MASQRSHVQLPVMGSDSVMQERFNVASKRGSRALRRQAKLWLKLTSSRIISQFTFGREPEPREIRKLILSTAFVFSALTALYSAFLWSGSTSHETFASGTSPPLHVSPQSELEIQLKRPPSIRRLLPPFRDHAREWMVPGNHLAPFVYTAVGILSQNVNTNSSEILLFLYTQGTIACTGEQATPCSHLDVTSCVVGTQSFPVLYEASGVFTCSISRVLRNGESLTVKISKKIWKRKLNTCEDSTVEEHLKSMKRFRDGSYIIPSNTVWEDQIDPPVADDEGRYKVCLMTQEKVFPDYVPEWLSYHRRIGIDFVYIYDNNSPKSLADMYRNATDVEVVNWPWERSQIQAQNHFLLVGRRRCQWGILIDVDEFIMMRPGHYEKMSELPLKAMLRDMREKRDISQVRVKSVVLGSSGHMYHPRGSVAESYWHLARFQDNLTKPIAWLGHVMPDSSVHRVETSPGYYTGLSTNHFDKQGEISSIGLCHLKYRSWEDYVEKGRGGRNSFQVGTWDQSSNWSIHSPPMNHLNAKNKEMFVDFRRIWRRSVGLRMLEPELASWHDVASRYERIKRKGWVWKQRRALITTENTTLSKALIERERAFQRLKDWEIAKKLRLAQWNKEVDFLT